MKKERFQNYVTIAEGIEIFIKEVLHAVAIEEDKKITRPNGIPVEILKIISQITKLYNTEIIPED